MLSLDDVALFRRVPVLRDEIPWVRLGHWPTPIEPLLGLPGAKVPVYVKREDLSNPRYGGNKVRTLEAALGLAVDAGAERIWATGAYGSNHATATVFHAKTAGLESGIALFPQPATITAQANLLAMLSLEPAICAMGSVIQLPFVMARLRWRDRKCYVMSPGAASPRGAFGALSAGLELAEQVAAGQCPAPARIVLPAGSTCTSAGLLAGLHLAPLLGAGFADKVPQVTSVRVTPWPVTSRIRIAHFAYRTAGLVARRANVARPSLARLYAGLSVDPRFLGGGYGCATAIGYQTVETFRRANGPALEVVYTAKSGAALLDLARKQQPGPLLFWATKSSAPLPEASPDSIARAPQSWRTWLDE